MHSIGLSNDPCDSDFHGSAPESEPETKALTDYARTLFPIGQRKDDPERDKDIPFREDITGMYVDILLSGAYGKSNKLDCPQNMKVYGKPFLIMIVMLYK